MILRSTDTAPEITPISGMAWHYVWELLEFGVFKNGYACHAYANGRHGGIERVTWWGASRSRMAHEAGR